MRVVYGELKGHFGRRQDPLRPTLYLRTMLEGIQTWLAELAAVVGGGRLNREGLLGQSRIGGGEVEDVLRGGDCKPTPLRESWCTPFDVSPLTPFDKG